MEIDYLLLVIVIFACFFLVFLFIALCTRYSIKRLKYVIYKFEKGLLFRLLEYVFLVTVGWVIGYFENNPNFVLAWFFLCTYSFLIYEIYKLKRRKKERAKIREIAESL